MSEELKLEQEALALLRQFQSAIDEYVKRQSELVELRNLFKNIQQAHQNMLDFNHPLFVDCRMAFRGLREHLSLDQDAPVIHKYIYQDVSGENSRLEDALKLRVKSKGGSHVSANN